MRRSSEEAFLYSLAVYLAVSALLTALLLLGALAAMKLSFAFASFALGPEKVYWVKPLIYDSLGFAAVSAATALLQYYLASLLQFSGAGRRSLAGAVLTCAVFCGLLFWRGAAHSSLGAYGFSGLCVTAAVLIGGLGAVLQAPGENPWPASYAARFR
jgi:hypothetical protein